jgi:hypothetical protein
MRFRPGHRQQQRQLAEQVVSNLPAYRAKLADPATPDYVRASLLRYIAQAEATLAKPIRTRKPSVRGASSEPLERDIQAEIKSALEAHPRVSMVVRFNSGGAYGADKSGREYLVKFASRRVVDLYVVLYEGRYAWLEVKKPGWQLGPWPPSNPKDRRAYTEHEQDKFLKEVRNAGGIGAFVRSVGEAMEALK